MPLTFGFTSVTIRSFRIFFNNAESINFIIYIKTNCIWTHCIRLVRNENDETNLNANNNIIIPDEIYNRAFIKLLLFDRRNRTLSSIGYATLISITRRARVQLCYLFVYLLTFYILYCIYIYVCIYIRKRCFSVGSPNIISPQIYS